MNSRDQFPKLLVSLGLTRFWIELGVATGSYSNTLARHRPPGCVQIAVDAWAGDRGHNESEYRHACESLSGAGVLVLRGSFADVVGLFADETLDFIYVDGYAHTGQHGGQTMNDWWPKLAPGGIMAGHDYCDAWPQTVAAVNEFAGDRGLKVSVVEGDSYPSWYVRRQS